MSASFYSFLSKILLQTSGKIRSVSFLNVIDVSSIVHASNFHVFIAPNLGVAFDSAV